MTLEEMTTALEAAQESIKRLEENNRALKAEKQTLQGEKDEAARKAREAEDAAATSGDDVEKVRASMQAKYDRDLKAAQDQLAEKGKELHSLKAHTEATTAMAKAGFTAGAQSLMLKAILAEASIGEDGKPTLEGKSISAYVADYAKTSEGKQFIKAPDSAGADAKSGSGEAKAAWTYEASQKDRAGFRAWAKSSEEAKAQANELYKGWTGTSEDVF